MKIRWILYINALLWLFSLAGLNIYSQGVPQGINYQAVARDFTGEELANRNISVRISVISGSVDGQVEWIENHSVTTNRFGLFNIVIGQGEREGGEKEEFTDIYWGYSPHFLKVAIKFTDEGEYLNMGATQFFSVPYALYAEYAASGTGGGPVDPDDHDKDATNEIQSLSINTEDNELLLINSDGSEQSSLPIDYEPENEIQDLAVNNNILRITKNDDANPISLVPYLDNTDNQTLILEEDSIRISGGNAVYITELKNPESIYFYAEKTTTTSPVPVVSDNYLIFNDEKANQGNAYNHTSGDFNALVTGLYSFYFTYNAKTTQRVSNYLNNEVYDILLQSAPTDSKVRYSFMLYLTAVDKVNMVINSGTSTEIGTATFTGFKVY
jgi:hypothetical protein